MRHAFIAGSIFTLLCLSAVFYACKDRLKRNPTVTQKDTSKIARANPDSVGDPETGQRAERSADGTVIYFDSYPYVGHGSIDLDQPYPPGKFGAFCKAFSYQINKLNSRKDDSLEKWNNDLMQLIRSYKDLMFGFPDTINQSFFNLVKSSDGNFLLISWDTRKGGTMVNYAAVALFQTSKGIKLKPLDVEQEEGDHGNFLYDTIIVLHNSAQRPLYLARGETQGASSYYAFFVDAFQVNGEQLKNATVFPDGNSAVGHTVDYANNRNRTSHDGPDTTDVPRTPLIQFLNGGRTIRVPSCNDESVPFNGHWCVYKFDGTRFNQVH